MNCQDLSLILDDRDVQDLTSAEREAVEVHLADCTDCADAWRVHQRGNSRTIPTMPDDLKDRVWRVLEANVPSTAPRRRIGRPFVLFSLLLAGAAAATIVAIQWADQVPQSADGMAQNTLGESPVESATEEIVPLLIARDVDDIASPPAAENDRTEVQSNPSASGAFDSASVAVLPVVLINTDSESLRQAANEVRNDIIRRLDESVELNLIDPELVESYVDSGLADIVIGRALGVRNLVFVRGQQDGERVTISFGTLDSATDSELFYGTVGMQSETLSAEAIRVNEANAANLIDRLTLAAYPDLEITFAERIVNNQTAAVNPGLSEDERVAALGELRNLGPSARSEAIIAAAVDIAVNSDDPRLRNRAWFTLSDLDNPTIVQPLLNSLRDDSSAIVRSVAVRLLSEYAEEPGVLAALEYAAAWDEDEGVRAQAASVAMSDEDRYAVVRTTFFDRSLPAEARVGALSSFFGSIGPGLSIDPDIADELFEIESDSDVGTTWAGTLLFYAEALDPKFVDPLLAMLDDEPERRAFAASVLHHFTDQPTVVEALELALEDPDRTVRNSAQRALERSP